MILEEIRPLYTLDHGVEIGISEESIVDSRFWAWCVYTAPQMFVPIKKTCEEGI